LRLSRSGPCSQTVASQAAESTWNPGTSARHKYGSPSACHHVDRRGAAGRGADARRPRAQRLAGRAGLAAIDAGDLRRPRAAGRRRAVAAQLQGAAGFARSAAQVWAELVDGSTLVGAEFVAAGGTARIKLRDSSTVEVPTAGLATVRLGEQLPQIARSGRESWHGTGPPTCC